MARVTSKRQVTIPKAIADQYRIAVGDDLEFVPAGDGLRIERRGEDKVKLDRDARLARFDQATKRQQARQTSERRVTDGDRGWTREGLYERGRAR